MHGEDRRADVDDVDVQGREVHGDRSAAARVDLAELARLPDDALLVEEPADFAEELRGGVRGGVLAAGASVLADADTLRDVGRVVRLHRFRVGRVHAGGDVSGQTLGRGEDVVAGDAGVLAEVLDEVLEVGGVEAGVAVGADLFLVGQDGDDGVLGVFHFEVRDGGRVAADLVVMAVCGDERAVEADVAGLEGRDQFEFRRQEVFFHDAVLLVEDLQDVELHELGLLLTLEGKGADEDVQVLALDGIGQGAFLLFLREVRQEIGDDELRVALVLADVHGDGRAVALDDDAVEGQRDGGPLVLLDAAVVVGLEEREFLLLIERVRFEVKARGVDVGRRDAQTFREGLLAEGRQDDALVPVDAVDAVAGLVGFGLVELSVASLLGLGLEERGDLPLGLVVRHEVFVAFREDVRLREQVFFHDRRHVFRCVEELFFQSFCVGFLCHGVHTFYHRPVPARYVRDWSLLAKLPLKRSKKLSRRGTMYASTNFAKFARRRCTFSFSSACSFRRFS